MPIEFMFRPIEGVLIIRVTDQFSFDELTHSRAFADDANFVDPEVPMVWDLTEMTPTSTDEAFIEQAIDVNRSLRTIKRGRQAIVTAEPVLAKWVDLYLIAVREYDFAPELRHFRGSRLDLAMEWLTAPAAPPKRLS